MNQEIKNKIKELKKKYVNDGTIYTGNTLFLILKRELEEAQKLLENQRKELLEELEFWKTVSAEQNQEFIEKIDKIKDSFKDGYSWSGYAVREQIDKIISENDSPYKINKKGNRLFEGENPSTDTSNQNCENCGHEEKCHFNSKLKDKVYLKSGCCFPVAGVKKGSHGYPKDEIPHSLRICGCKKFKKKEVEDEN